MGGGREGKERKKESRSLGAQAEKKKEEKKGTDLQFLGERTKGIACRERGTPSLNPEKERGVIQEIKMFLFSIISDREEKKEGYLQFLQWEKEG